MKLDLNLSTVLAALVALRDRAAELEAHGIYDAKWLRAHRELTRACAESMSKDSAAELAQSAFLRH